MILLPTFAISSTGSVVILRRMHILVIRFTMIVPRQHSMMVGQTIKGYSVLISVFFLIFDTNKNRINCTAVPLLFQIVLITAEAVSVSSDKLFYPLLLSVRVTCNQPSCYDCSHRAIIFQFVAPNILLQRWKQMINARRRILLISPQ